MALTILATCACEVHDGRDVLQLEDERRVEDVLGGGARVHVPAGPTGAQEHSPEVTAQTERRPGIVMQGAAG